MNPKTLIDQGVPVEHLKIGECIFTRNQVIISTVLGSCVGASFYCPKTGYAALFHSMLPHSSMARTINRECNYVDLAIKHIADRYKELNIDLKSLTVKLFGGANTMRPEEKGLVGEMLDVGKKNVDQARSELEALGITIKIEDVQGPAGRKIFFYTATGDVWLKRLPGHLAEQYRMKNA